MPLFVKNQAGFRDGIKDYDSDRYKHLTKMVVAGKAVGRAPELAGTTVLFLPYPNFENPNYKADLDVLPDRLSDDPMDYSRWLFYADGVLKFGKNPVSILFDDPDKDGWSASESNPVHMIRDSVARAVKSGQTIETPFGTSESDRWKLLLEGDKERKIYSVLPKPTQLIMAYALVYSSGNKSYIMEGAPLGSASTDLPVILVMSQFTAMKSLIPQISDVDSRGEPTFPVVTGTKFIHFYDKKENNCQAMKNASAAAATSLGTARRQNSANQGADTSTQLAGYGIYVSDTYTGLPATGLPPKREDIVKLAVNRLRPWEQTLRGHSPEEAARLISEYCGLPMSMLYYAWKSCPHYYSDEMRTRLKNPVSADFHNAPVQLGETEAENELESFNWNAPTAQTQTIDSDIDYTKDRGAPGGPTLASDPGLPYDDKQVAAAQAKFKQHMSQQANK